MLFDLDKEEYSKAWNMIDDNTTVDELDEIEEQFSQKEIEDGGSQNEKEKNVEPQQDFFNDDEKQLIEKEEYNEEKLQEEKQEPKQEKEEEKRLVDSLEVNLNGQKIIVTADEVQDLLQKGLQARLELKELQEIKPIFDFLIENGIDKKDLIALKDLKSGNKEALQYFKDLAGIRDDDGWFNDDNDEFIFDDEPQPKQKQKKYEPKLDEDNNKDPMEAYIEYVYSQDPDLANRALTILNSLPNSIKLELYNEQLFPSFVQSVKTGEWDKVSPLALKIYVKDNKIDFKFAYQKAIQMLQNSNLQENEPPQMQQVQQQNKSSNNRNLENATIPYTDDSSDGGSQLSYEDYWNMPLEELEKLTN